MSSFSSTSHPIPSLAFLSIISASFPASSSAWLPWLYDTAVIILVVWKSLMYRRGIGLSGLTSGRDLTRALIKDGLLYYSCVFYCWISRTEMLRVLCSLIFAANCSLTIMIIRAPVSFATFSVSAVLISSHISRDYKTSWHSKFTQLLVHLLKRVSGSKFCESSHQFQLYLILVSKI